MSAPIIPYDYKGQAVRFNADGWLNATQIAERFGKRLDRWFENADTLEYICALDEVLTGEKSEILHTRNSGYVKTSKARVDRGGGTWLHPKLAITFARWCDAKFSVWCDMRIAALLNTDPATLQKYGQACQLLDDGRNEASRGASLLANWRWSRPRLEQSIAYWREQLQLPLALDES